MCSHGNNFYYPQKDYLKPMVEVELESFFNSLHLNENKSFISKKAFIQNCRYVCIYIVENDLFLLSLREVE